MVSDFQDLRKYYSGKGLDFSCPHIPRSNRGVSRLWKCEDRLPQKRDSTQTGLHRAKLVHFE